MEIKEPAAIFSEAGLKIFIEAIKEYERNSQSDTNEVDQLVKEYKVYKEKKDEPNKMEMITEVLTEFFEDGKVKTTEKIKNYLNSEWGFQYNLRSMTSLMRGVMKRNTNIKKLNAKQYQMIIDGMNDHE